MADKHIVVQGAKLKCQFSVEPKTDVLKVNSHSRESANDKEGTEKYIATTMEIGGQTLEKNTFGKCKKQPNGSGDFLPCIPMLTKWEDEYENVTLSNGGKILLEDSKATCPMGAPGCITVENHGQTGEGSQQQVKQGNNNAQNQANPVFKDFVEDQTQNKADEKPIGVEEKREIVRVDMENIDGKPIPKGEKFHYGKVVNTVIHTTGMVGELLHVEMWEDDAIGAGHSDENRYNKVQEQLVFVGEKGVAEVRFVISNAYRKIATAHNAYEGKTHEYYIIAYANETPITASGNINIYAPEYKEEKKKVIVEKIKGIEPVGVQEPKQKIKAEAPRVIPPATPKPTPKKPAAPKPTEPKVVEPKKITYIFFTDDKNHKIVNAKYGDTIRAHIGSTGLIDHKVKIKAYDHEVMGENHFLGEVGNYTISANLCHVDIVLTKEMKEHGANLFSDEVYVDIEIMETKAHVVSTQIKVDTNNTIFEIARNITKAKVGTSDVKKEGLCFCKQKENQFNWSSVLTCDQRKKVLQVCKNLWPASKANEKASELMSIFHLETDKTFSPSIDNGVGFSGLIQFSDASAKGLGTTRSKLKAMTFTEQMNYVEKYLSKNKAKLTTMTDLYLMVLKPNAVGQGTNPNYVLFDESIKVPDGDGSNTSQSQRLININQEPWVTKYGYASNPTYHLEKGEHDLRKKWVYTRQRFELRRGFIDGKTIVKEVTEVLVNGHYNPGKAKIFIGKCETLKEDKKESDERTPWMNIAIEEAKNYGGKKEKLINERIKTYHKDGGGSDGSSSVAWCASFVCWCIEQKNYKSPHSAGSRMFLTSSNAEKCEAFYGCIAVFSDCDSTGKKTQSTGHSTFVFGKLPGNEIYACLGGNQADMLKMSKYDCSGSVFVSWKEKKVTHYKIFRGFYKPTGYSITNNDKLTKEDNYTSADEASKTALNLNIISNEKGESSR
jgi:uncharacterized protein (TIGR02594 family)